MRFSRISNCHHRIRMAEMAEMAEMVKVSETGARRVHRGGDKNGAVTNLLGASREHIRIHLRGVKSILIGIRVSIDIEMRQKEIG